MMPITLPTGTGMRARHFTPLVLALALAGTALVAQTVRGWVSYARTPSSFSETRTSLETEMAGLALSIPGNMLRHGLPPAGADRASDSLDLTVLWPSMEGYSQANADAFADFGDTSPVMSVALRADDGQMDTNTRFEKVWLSLAAGDALPGPAGLALLPLVADSSAGTDFVAHRSENGQLFAARCFTPRDRNLAATCQRTLRSETGLVVSYRFRQAHLADWRKLDGAMRGLVASFVRGT